MVPVIMDGDFVAGTRVERPERIRDGLLYVVVSRTQGLALKYLQVRTEGLRCYSENSTFQPYDLEFEEVREIWEVQLRVTRHILNQRYEVVPAPGAAQGALERIERLMVELIERRALEP
jgi:hypothetical protein